MRAAGERPWVRSARTGRRNSPAIAFPGQGLRANFAVAPFCVFDEMRDASRAAVALFGVWRMKHEDHEGHKEHEEERERKGGNAEPLLSNLSSWSWCTLG